jgi:hypothetical protein
MKQRLEPLVVHDAAAAADLGRDAVGALLDPSRRFGIDRGTIADPLHDGVQVCQDLRVDAGYLGFGGVHLAGIPANTRHSWFRARAEAAILESQGDLPAALGKLAVCPSIVIVFERLASSSIAQELQARSGHASAEHKKADQSRFSR